MSYPPDEHVLRDLALEVEYRPDHTATGWLPATPHVLTPHGTVDPGVLAALVDVIGGGLSIRLVLPDWVATADLTLQLLGTTAVPGEVVEATTTVVRKGRTTLVTEVDLSCAGRTLGWGSMTFAVLPRRDDTLVITSPGNEVTRTNFAPDGQRLRVPMPDALDVTVLEPGVVSMPWSDYVRNSLGATQGGILAWLGGFAGQTALGDDVVVLDLHVAYLELARNGPFVARADVLGPAAATVRVTDGDSDSRGQLTTIVHVGGAAA